MSITDVKPSYMSKTVVVNAIFCIIIWAFSLAKIEIPADVAISISTVINIVLRIISTGKVTIV